MAKASSDYLIVCVIVDEFDDLSCKITDHFTNKKGNIYLKITRCLAKFLSVIMRIFVKKVCIVML